MNTPAEQEAQVFLIELQQFIAGHRPNSVPKYASIHIAPDSAWISVEHDYQIQHLGEGDAVFICDRKPPSCHTILTKI